MKMAQIRERLHKIADRLWYLGLLGEGFEISLLAEATKRRSPVRRAPKKRSALTPELRAAIRQYAGLNTSASYQEMAELFKVNSGRVSEALAGFKE